MSPQHVSDALYNHKHLLHLFLFRLRSIYKFIRVHMLHNIKGDPTNELNTWLNIRQGFPLGFRYIFFIHPSDVNLEVACFLWLFELFFSFFYGYYFAALIYVFSFLSFYMTRSTVSSPSVTWLEDELGNKIFTSAISAIPIANDFARGVISSKLANRDLYGLTCTNYCLYETPPPFESGTSLSLLSIMSVKNRLYQLSWTRDCTSNLSGFSKWIDLIASFWPSFSCKSSSSFATSCSM